MRHDSFVIRADICYSASPQSLRLYPGGWLVCLEGRSAGVFQALPEQYASLPVLDCGRSLVVPGLTDLHVHAPQYASRGQGMDLELLDWLDRYTFPEESKYASLDYAGQAYQRFVEDVRRGPNTRACVFATIHPEATIRLMDLLEESGLCTMVGKVNMDRSCPEALREPSAAASVESTKAWLEGIEGRYSRTRPILTPRFIPSCTDALMEELGRLQRQYGLPVQSHLSESRSEIAWVRELCPAARNYGDAYRAFGLLGGPGCPTVMAHCVYSDGEEAALLKAKCADRPLSRVQYEPVLRDRACPPLSAGRPTGWPGQRCGGGYAHVHFQSDGGRHSGIQAAVAAGGPVPCAVDGQ